MLRHGRSLHRVLVAPFSKERSARDPRVWLPLLVAHEFDEDTVWELAEEGESFLDEQGNAQLVLDGEVVLFAQASQSARTKSPRSTAERRTRAQQLKDELATLNFSRVSHQVAFALLCSPGLAAAPVRELALASGASVGTAHRLLEELSIKGHVVNGRLRNTRRMLDEWVAAYQRLLIEPLTARPLFAAGVEWIYQLGLDSSTGTLAGGAAAAGMVTGQLRATDGIAYVRDLGAAVKLLRLTPNPTPYRVELRERFWGEGLPSPEPGFVPSVLLYGDLLRDGDGRSRETARYLREHDAHLRALDRG